MTKKEFEQIVNACNQISNQAYNKLGLLCKKFTKIYGNEISDISDERYFIVAELAEKSDGQLKLDENKNPIVLDSNTKHLSDRVKSWGQEEIEFELNKHIVYKPNLEKETKLFLVSPVIYDILNSYVFDLSEDEYLDILDQYQEELK